MLNPRSAQIGTWIVVVQQANLEEYGYVWNGEPKSGKTFSCVLVSMLDPKEYCLAHIRFMRKFESAFNKVNERMVDGHAFTMSRVSIDTKAKKQYTHTPIQIVIDLGSTVFSPLLHSKEHAKCYPEPSATIADCIHLTNS